MSTATQRLCWGLSGLLFSTYIDAQTLPPTPSPESAASQDSVTAPPTEAPAVEIEVRSVRPRRDAFSSRHSAHTASKVSGTQGDPLKIVENLPGVARAPFGGSQVVLWGATPEDTRTYVDGVEIPRLFHDAALSSTLGTAFIQDVAVTPGAYGADYGRGLGGVVQIRTSEIRTEPQVFIHGRSFDASAGAQGELGSTRSGVAFRRGFLDQVLGTLVNPSALALIALPRYHDYQVKSQLDLSQRETLDVVVLGSSDVSIRKVQTNRSAGQRTEREAAFERAYVTYRYAFDDGGEAKVTPWVGREYSAYRAQFGDRKLTAQERTLCFGLRAEHRAPVSELTTLAIGVDAQGASADLERVGSPTLPAREGDQTVFGERPSAETNADNFGASTVAIAPYLSADTSIGALRVSPQLRVDGYLLESSRLTPRVGATPAIGSSRFDVRVHPRVQATYPMTPRVTFLAAAGTYSQAPKRTDLSAVFGMPTLGPEGATHLALGETLTIARELSLATTVFHKWMHHLVTRSSSPTPLLAQALTQTGRGTSYGLQSQLEWRTANFSGFASYTLSRSERTAVGAGTRLFDFDQPHVFTAVSNRELGAWMVGLRVRYASGMPRSQVVGSVYNATRGVHEPLLGAHNAIRLPDFFQLDARVDRTFTFNPQQRLVLSLEVLNVTARANAEEYVYNTDYSERGLLTGLPLIGTLGVRLEL